MIDAGIGRLLIASLHQGIADVAPTRLDFYENWLSPTGMREGRMGLAPLGAVLSFLHREETPDDRRIPAAAGACAASWALADVSPFRLRAIGRLPLGWRTRATLGLARDMVCETITESTVKTRVRRGTAEIVIASPLFEYLREPAFVPMRRYYGALYGEVLRAGGLDADVEIDEVGPTCRLQVTVRGVRPKSASLLEAS